ncbi:MULTISPECIES: SDR family oxidoreductase [unclassified Achromobacter]|uniref:SDR family oxidoreductase n=1 Tax=unclassified Achromobacter TaxID=2626865 RepID=UPI000B51A07D|nr:MULTISPECIES: SDR family oxidoreductase [unclassified Achromobacter]OWT81124.1 oxidoreductase [Achromobacter sp. HZ34]OWT82625.1 oxidoreductase [Achromobacter sp. HZ28]
MKTKGNTILITGGGSGIGEALAHRLHDQGNKVLIAGRRLDALKKAAAGRQNIVPVELDIDSPEKIEAFARRIVADHPTLNVLINNAGIMRAEKLDQRRDLSDAEATITTNLLGPIRLINALVDHLASQPDATIINNSSGLAFVPLIHTPTYSATKAAIHSYTVSLREVLKGRIEVIELAPPAVQTTLTPGQESREGYQPLTEFADEVVSLLNTQPTPAEVLVKRVGFLRFAEQENRYAEALKAVNSH